MKEKQIKRNMHEFTETCVWTWCLDFFFWGDLGLIREVENFSKHARISVNTALLIRAASR